MTCSAKGCRRKGRVEITRTLQSGLTITFPFCDIHADKERTAPATITSEKKVEG